MMDKDKAVISIYAFWAIIVFAISFLNKDLGNENFTRILLIIFFLFQLLVYFTFLKNKNLTIKYPKLTFIALGLILASIVEGFHMFSKPVFASLAIDSQTALFLGLRNYLIDLLFTLPAYFIIFSIILFFISKYKYSLWEYFIFISLGQALGDGGFFFLSDPLALVLLPYVMLNYHSMNLLPYLLVKDKLTSKNKSLAKYLAPIIIIIIYIASGIIINLIGKFVGLI